MMVKMHRTCPECGARAADDAVQCDLCGSLLDQAEIEEPAEPTASDDVRDDTPPPDSPAVDELSVPLERAPAAAEPVGPPEGIFCNQCGWKNPGDARYCSRCGTRLQTIASVPSRPDESRPQAAGAPVPPRAAPPPRADAEEDLPPERGVPAGARTAVKHQQAVTRQVGIIIGAGVLLVLALFLITAVSKTRTENPTTPAVPPAQNATPATGDLDEGPALPAQLVEQVEALEAEMAQLEGAARLDKQRELAALYFGAGRLDRAALEQQQIAEATNTVDDWKRAGDLFYDWMDTTPNAARKAQIAGRAIEAYQRVLAEDPDNLDVRTDMATAYLSSNNPMQGVTEIKSVLDADPDHLHARFNYGIMLAMIGRTELSIEQFEYVKTLVDESSTYYRQADEAIRVIQSGGSLGL